MTTSHKSYLELSQLKTYEERLEYLKLDGLVGDITFGTDRHLNQKLYSSFEWKQAREKAIFRDLACDLGISGFEINSDILVHHINPITLDDIYEDPKKLFSLDNLITTTLTTHNDIHYSRTNSAPRVTLLRKPGDTKLW